MSNSDRINFTSGSTSNLGNLTSVLGGHDHLITMGTQNATIAGGACNMNNGQCSFIGAGFANTSSAQMNFIGSGCTNYASRDLGAVVAGQDNCNAGIASFIGAGTDNYVDYCSVATSVLGGNRNKVCNASCCAAIVGGEKNSLCFAPFSTIVGGCMNTISGSSQISFSTIISGKENLVQGNYAAAGGEFAQATGDQSIAYGYAVTASGGASAAFGAVNNAKGGNSFALGGQTNLASGLDAVASGCGNTASGCQSFVIGTGATASGNSSFAGGGSGTKATNEGSFAFGQGNCACRTNSAVLGGCLNKALGSGCDIIAGGFCNEITSGIGNAIVGGAQNYIQAGNHNFIGSGGSNCITMDTNINGYTAVNGICNISDGDGSYSFMAGGYNNNFGAYSIVLGNGSVGSKGNVQVAIGCGITTPTSATAARGDSQVIVGKFNDYAGSTCVHRFAVGNGTSDTSRSTKFAVIGSGTSNGQVAVNSTNGCSFYTFFVNGSAAKPFGGSWSNSSDERLKTNIQNYTKSLSDIIQIQPRTFDYTGAANHPTGSGIGIIAQEIQSIFPETIHNFTAKLNENDEEETTDLLGFQQDPLIFAAINAIKELNTKVEQLEQRIQELEG